MSYMIKRHERGVARKNTYKHIERKKRILEFYAAENEEVPHGQLNRLSKAKVHCSCPLCEEKTRKQGWKHSDQVKLDKLMYQD